MMRDAGGQRKEVKNKESRGNKKKREKEGCKISSPLYVLVFLSGACTRSCKMKRVEMMRMARWRISPHGVDEEGMRERRE